jgi:hypothetical protein
MERWRERILQFLFPAESDTWLAVLRLGLGLQVMLYTLSLQDDWSYLLTGTGTGLIGRKLGEAMLSLESPFVPRLGWLVTFGAYFGISEETVLSIAWICWSRLWLAHRLSLPLSRDTSVVPSSLCDYKRRCALLWSGQLYDDRTVLFDVVAASRSVLTRSAMATLAAERSTIARLFSTRVAGSSVSYLFFQWPDEMFGERLVGWIEYLARIDQPALQYNCS